MRMVIELKRGEVPEVVLNKLYKDTQMQDTFGMNMVALLDGQPRLLNLKQMLEAFLRHRREVITRRTKFELKKARERGHVLEGLAVALANVDEIIAMIKASATPAEAKAGLMTRAWRSPLVEEMLARAQQGDAYRPTGLAYEFGLHPDGYHLTDVQAQAILDLRLQRLTGPWSRTKSSASIARWSTASPTCWTSSTSPSGSRRSSPKNSTPSKTSSATSGVARSSPTPRNSAWKI
jgi:DNA gyrase subunit A